MDTVIERNVEIEIPNEDFCLKGSIYELKNKKYNKKWIINLPGLLEHRESKFVKFFSEKFASAGFHVLSYDYRAHGLTAEVTGKNWLKHLPKIFSDIHSVIDWIYNYDGKGDIFLFGRSLGGAIILTHGFEENRAKKLIALCTRYDYHSFKKVPFPEKTIKLISPIYFLEKNYQNPNRILLAHCRDDNQIPFENLQHIKNHLDLPPKNTLIYEKGGHSFKDHREDILNKAIEFMKE